MTATSLLFPFLVASARALAPLALAPAHAPALPAAAWSPPQEATPGKIPEIQVAGDFYVLNLDETGEGIDLEWFSKLSEPATGINFTYAEPTGQAPAGSPAGRQQGRGRAWAPPHVMRMRPSCG